MLVGALVVALLVPASAIGSGPAFHPYEADPPEYAVAHESTEAFEEALETAEVDVESAVHVDDLSPQSRYVFEMALGAPTETRYGWNGWQPAEVTVCQESMLVCDEFDRPPEFPTHGSWSSDSKTSQTYAVVERGGDLYVVETRHLHAVNLLIGIVDHLLLLSSVAFSVLLALGAYLHRESRAGAVLGLTGYGLVIALWPYVGMAAGVEIVSWLVLPAIGGGILAALFLLTRS